MMRACEVRRSTTRALSSCSRLVVSSALASAACTLANALASRTEIGRINSPAGTSASPTAPLEAENGARIIASGGPSRPASTTQLTIASGNSAVR